MIMACSIVRVDYEIFMQTKCMHHCMSLGSICASAHKKSKTLINGLDDNINLNN